MKPAIVTVIEMGLEFLERLENRIDYLSEKVSSGDGTDVENNILEGLFDQGVRILACSNESTLSEIADRGREFLNANYQLMTTTAIVKQGDGNDPFAHLYKKKG